MKKIILALSLFLVGFTTTIYAQDTKEQQRKERKAEQKAQEELENAIAYQNAVAALKNKQVVLEADQLVYKNGESTFVNSNTNFIMLKGDKGTVQVTFNTANPGPNGIGGITVDGTITDVKMKITKKGNVTYRFNVQGVGISAQIFLTLRTGNNYASASISPNFNSNSITMNGRLLPLEESSVFKGTAL